MVAMINPFDAGGYSLAEMTQAINILPNVYTRLGQMGLFRFEGVTQRSVVIEQAEGVLNLLPIPILDGGAMTLLLVESVMGRDLSLRMKERIVQVSFVFLLMLFVIVMYNDVMKLLPPAQPTP